MPPPDRDAKSIFCDAIELPPADRPAYLDAACGGNAALRTEVEALLAAHDRDDRFLGGAGGDSGPTVVAPGGRPIPTNDSATRSWEAGRSFTPLPGEAAGTVVGDRYKLIEPIGAGGMGTVWLAHQTVPVRRPVAVKLIRLGMDSAQVLARFEAERQALALMDHPNIAKVLDAGATDDGRPFFVMELVKGVPITRFCDDRRLSLRDRLELFLPVCRAIQHAHQKGVIHRDVKPSNVLVALYDDRPVPKVIDFGIAKAAGEPLTDRTLQTGIGMVVGTPQYMAPEQATLNNLDVDTRADVYGLGALLYELLTGAPPFSRVDLHKAGLLEVLRVVREIDPPRPSNRVSSAAGRPEVAAARGTDPGRLAGLLRTDLDWVVMKALEKDRNRRYESAAGFAADVESYLAGRPVQAAPPSASYRVGKFVRRHRTGVAAGLVLAVSLAAGVAGTAVGLIQAERAATEKARIEGEAATKARKLSGLLQRLLTSADPTVVVGDGVTAGPGYTVAQLLDDNAAKLWDGLEDQPEVEADLRSTVGLAYLALAGLRSEAGGTGTEPDRVEKAVPQLERALELRRKVFGPDDPRVADAHTNLAVTFTHSVGGHFRWEEQAERVARAREHAVEAVAILRRAGPDHALTLARALIVYGRTVGNEWSKENGEAEAAFREGLVIAEAGAGDAARNMTAWAHWHLAEYALRYASKPAEAIPHAQQALALWGQDPGGALIVTSETQVILARCYLGTHEFARAEEHARVALATYRKVLRDHQSWAASDALRWLVQALAMQYRDEDAAAALRACPPGWRTAEYRFLSGQWVAFGWGYACEFRGDYADAERHYRTALAVQSAQPGRFSAEVERNFRHHLAIALVLQERFAEARAVFGEGMLAAARVAAKGPVGDVHLQNLHPADFYAEVLLAGGVTEPADLQAVVRLTDRRLKELAGRPLSERWWAEYYNLLSHHFLGEHEPVINGMPNLLASLGPWDLVGRRVIEKYLVASLEQTNQLEKAQQVLQGAVAYTNEHLPPGHPEVAIRRVFLADFLTRHGRPDEAAAELEAAYTLLATHPQAAGRSLTRRRADVVDQLIRVSVARGRPAEAALWRAERAKYPPPEAPSPRPK